MEQPPGDRPTVEYEFVLARPVRESECVDIDLSPAGMGRIPLKWPDGPNGGLESIALRKRRAAHDHSCCRGCRDPEQTQPSRWLCRHASPSIHGPRLATGTDAHRGVELVLTSHSVRRDAVVLAAVRPATGTPMADASGHRRCRFRTARSRPGSQRPRSRHRRRRWSDRRGEPGFRRCVRRWPRSCSCRC
jgi:hypothetical protein